MIRTMLDSHAHIAADQFDSDRDVLIASAKENGLSWIEVGTDVVGSMRAVAIAKQYSHLFASVGVHPDEIARITGEDWKTLEALATNSKVCAIGEVGFDFSRVVIPAEGPKSTRQSGGQAWIPGQARDDRLSFQEVTLRRFIKLAQQVHKPVIFHVRSGNSIDSHAELLRVLSSYPSSELPRGVIHTFSGTMQQANEYIALGMMISFSGVITFKNAEQLRDIARTIPLSSLLVETDCPFLTPEPFRGKRNEPSYVRYVVQRIAEVRGVSLEEIERVADENTRVLFGI